MRYRIGNKEVSKEIFEWFWETFFKNLKFVEITTGGEKEM